MYQILKRGLFIGAVAALSVTSAIAKEENSIYNQDRFNCEFHFFFKPTASYIEEDSSFRRLQVRTESDTPYFGVANSKRDSLVIKKRGLHSIDLHDVEKLVSFESATGVDVSNVEIMQSSPTRDGSQIRVVVAETVNVVKTPMQMLDEGLISLALRTGFTEQKMRYSVLTFDLEGQLKSQLNLDEYYPTGYISTSRSLFTESPIYINGDAAYIQPNGERPNQLFRVDLSNQESPGINVTSTDLFDLAANEDPVRMINLNPDRILSDIALFNDGNETFDVVSYLPASNKYNPYAKFDIFMINVLGDETLLWSSGSSPDFQDGEFIRVTEDNHIVTVLSASNGELGVLQRAILKIKPGKGIVGAWIATGLFTGQTDLYTLGNSLVMYGQKGLESFDSNDFGDPIVSVIDTTK